MNGIKTLQTYKKVCCFEFYSVWLECIAYTTGKKSHSNEIYVYTKR